MDTLILALDTFVLSLSAGISIFVVSSLTSESELFSGLRRWLVRRAEAHTPTNWFDDNDHTSQLAYAFIYKFNWFLADAIKCPFCSSWWHGLWIATMFSLVMSHHMLLGFLIYLPSVGICRVLSRLTNSLAVSKAVAYGAEAPSGDLREQYLKMKQRMESIDSDV